MWEDTMSTVSIIGVCTLLSIGIGIPVGVLMAKSERAQRICTPILDVMQTMPSFVYLIPVVMLLGIGKIPGLLAVVIYAIPPIIRLTNLGIREVDSEVLEAADAFGANPRQKLFQIQLPLALPTIFAGINQTIMMALAMVVIASMIGVKGLGQPVLKAITNQYFEGGQAPTAAQLNAVYNSVAGDSVKGKERLGSVILPMPKVVDTNGCEWGESKLNIFGLAAVSVGEELGKIGASKETQDEIAKIQQLTKDKKTSGLKDLAGVTGAAAFSQGAALAGIDIDQNAFLARTGGRVLNPNAELLFTGPVLRDFNFDFLMIARSQKEGKEIRKIIRWFKSGMAPKFNNSTFLQTPDVFELQYVRDPQISPDGTKIVYVRTEMDIMKDGRTSSLWIINSDCLLYTSPSPRDRTRSRMPSSA